MKNSEPTSKLSRLVPGAFAAFLLLRLMACNGTDDGGGQSGSGGQGGSGAHGGSGGHGGSGTLPDPPPQSCMTDGDCQPTPSMCADDAYTEVDFIMPSCGADGVCHWVKQTVDCPDGCEDGVCFVTTDTAGGT